MLVFPSYEFEGSASHNGTSCYQWSGCHGYEVKLKFSIRIRSEISLNVDRSVSDTHRIILYFESSMVLFTN